MNRYWFKPKTYGYGATPVTWEGWMVALGYLGVVLGLSVGLLGVQLTPQRWLLWVVLVAVATIVMTWVAKSKTEGEWRWRWGRTNTGRM